MSGRHSCGLQSHLHSAEVEHSETARFFLCARCRTQALICRCCDRGQIYCSGDCAREARREFQRQAAQRYQASPRGRAAHALRARRFRARQRSVTHQGPATPQHDPTPVKPATQSEPSSARGVPMRPGFTCSRCRRRCSRFVRQGFLRPHRAYRVGARYPVRRRPP